MKLACEISVAKPTIIAICLCSVAAIMMASSGCAHDGQGGWVPRFKSLGYSDGSLDRSVKIDRSAPTTPHEVGESQLKLRLWGGTDPESVVLLAAFFSEPNHLPEFTKAYYEGYAEGRKSHVSEKVTHKEGGENNPEELIRELSVLLTQMGKTRTLTEGAQSFVKKVLARKSLSEQALGAKVLVIAYSLDKRLRPQLLQLSDARAAKEDAALSEFWTDLLRCLK